MTWTHFWDMHSGGSLKTKWHHIFIEAPQAEAERVFRERTGRDPHNETCDCCGPDYSIFEEPTLEQATAYHRNCDFNHESRVYVERQDPRKTWPSGKYVPLDEYVNRDDVLVIRASEVSS